MKKYTIIYFHVDPKRVAIVTEYIPDNDIKFPDIATRLDDIDLYTAKEQLEEQGVDCSLIDEQIEADEMDLRK